MTIDKAIAVLDKSHGYYDLSYGGFCVIDSSNITPDELDALAVLIANRVTYPVVDNGGDDGHH
jgi:hypothetical protein